jgi:hypothetical protein
VSDPWLVHLNRISLSALLQTSNKENQIFLGCSTLSNSASIYTSLGWKSRVRLRVTCDFGLWRRRGEKRSRRGAPAHFGGGERRARSSRSLPAAKKRARSSRSSPAAKRRARSNRSSPAGQMQARSSWSSASRW